MGTSACIERMTQTSSIISPTSGKSSLTSIPLSPYFLNENGEIEQMGGNKAVDFDRLPGRVVPEQDKENSLPQPEDDPVKAQQLGDVERVFVLDDLDF